MGEGGFKGISDFGGGGEGSGGAGAGMGAGSAGAGALGGALSKAQDLSAANAGAEGAGGRMSRVARRGISKGRFGSKNTGTVKGNTRAAARTATGGSGGFQQQAGAVNAGFGGGTSGNTLNIPGGPAGNLGDGGLDGGVDNPNSDLDTKADEPSITEDTPEDYDSETTAVAVLILGACAIGIGLAIASALKATPFASAAWWIAYAAGVIMLLVALAIVIDLMTSDSASASAVGGALLGNLLPTMAAYALIAIGQMAMAGLGLGMTAATTIMGMATKSDESTPPTG